MNIRLFSFEKLEAYKEARILVKDIYLLLHKFPKTETYALCDQLRRSAVSITSNIAEGSGRNSTKEKIHFLEISFGSMMECFSQLQIAQDLGYVTEDDMEQIRTKFNTVASLISGLKRSLEQSLTVNS